ncbi:hypothetical protein U6B65_02495 [Oscillospiraceae bacterium MB08-C2-2]|nr:hypothetical protein U6B65_02495 [Oscillospiraceae bacterium MB08-C2-2]
MSGKKSEKILHGNSAKIDPQKKITGAYTTNTITAYNKKENETPIISDENVRLSRKYVDENHK